MYRTTQWNHRQRYWCKTHAKINRKIGNSTPPPCEFVTHKNVKLKLGTPTKQMLVLIGTVMGAYRRNITTLWLFLTLLSCPFFSETRPGLTAEPIFALYTSSDVFSRNEVPFGVKTTGDVIWGKHAKKTFQKWPWIGNFKPKRQNIKFVISPKL